MISLWFIGMNQITLITRNLLSTLSKEVIGGGLREKGGEAIDSLMFLFQTGRRCLHSKQAESIVTLFTSIFSDAAFFRSSSRTT